jgi:hypothetical protein
MGNKVFSAWFSSEDAGLFARLYSLHTVSPYFVKGRLLWLKRDGALRKNRFDALSLAS